MRILNTVTGATLLLGASFALGLAGCATDMKLASVDGRRKRGMAALNDGHYDVCIAEMTGVITDTTPLLTSAPNREPEVRLHLYSAHFGRGRCLQALSKHADAVADFETASGLLSVACQKQGRQYACKQAADAAEQMAISKKQLTSEVKKL